MANPVTKPFSPSGAYSLEQGVSLRELSSIENFLENRQYQAASDAIQRAIPRLPRETYTTPVSTEFLRIFQDLKARMEASLEQEDFVQAACLGKIIARMCVSEETIHCSHGGRIVVYERDIKDPLVEALTDAPDLQHRFWFWLEGQSPEENPHFSSFENPPVRIPPPRPAPPPAAPSHARSAPRAQDPPHGYYFEEGAAAPLPLPEDEWDDLVPAPSHMEARRNPFPQVSAAAAPPPPRVSAVPRSPFEDLNNSNQYQHLPHLEWDRNTTTGVTAPSAQRFRNELRGVTQELALEMVSCMQQGRALTDAGLLAHIKLASMTDYLNGAIRSLPEAQGEALHAFMTEHPPLVVAVAPPAPP